MAAEDSSTSDSASEGTSKGANLHRTISENAVKSAKRLQKTVTEHAEYAFDGGPTVHNTSLYRIILGDTVAAAITSFAVSPVVTICDKAVCDAAAGHMSMTSSIRSSTKTLLTQPHHFFMSKGFVLVWGVYTLTYGVSNVVQSVFKRAGKNPALPTFLATAAVNIPSSVFQDRFFTSWFGTARKGRFHPATYALWATRDMATVLGSFTLPGLLAGHLQKATGTTSERARFGAQLLVPSMVAVVVHPPLHLLGIDIYNRPALQLAERLPMIGSLLPKTALLRFCRVMPAFGCGGIINGSVRETISGIPKA